MKSFPKTFGYILWIVLILSTGSSNAQSPPQNIYEFENIDISNDKIIKNALYDSQQNLWLYTENGIYRRSKVNSKIKQYFIKDSWNVESSILFEDKQNRIWFCDERKDSTLRYIFQDTIHSINLPFQIRITGIIEKPTGTFWISTLGRGLLQLQSTLNNKWTYHFYNNSNKLPLDIYSAFADNQKNIYLITRKGLVNWNANDESSNLIPLELPKSTQLSFGTILTDSVILLGTWGNGLYTLNLFTNEFSPWNTAKAIDNNQLFIAGINRLDKEILISTWGNGSLIYKDNQLYELSNKTGLPGNKIYNTILAPKNRYLIIQKNLGISSIENLTLYRSFSISNSISNYNSITKNQNNGYLLSKNGGISFFSELNTKSIIDPKWNIMSCLQINEHEFILASYGEGLIHYNDKSEKAITLLTLNGKSNYILTSIKDSDNDSIIWMGSLEGLMSYNFISGDKFFPAVFENNKINQIISLEGGHLLLNSEDSGLFDYNKYSNEAKLITDTKHKTLFASSLRKTNNNEIYFSTYEGEIYTYKANDIYPIKICQTKEATKINYYAVNFNKILIGTDNGISLFDMHTKKWLGLNDQFGGVFKKKVHPLNLSGLNVKENIFINENGICLLSNSVYFLQAIIPEFLLDSIYVAGVNTKINNGGLEIKYNESIDLYLSFTKVPIPENVKVEYRFNKDSTWLASNNNRHLLLTNLSTGNHQLSIRYSIDGYNWTEKEICKIAVTLPWYLNFTFYIYLAVFAIFLTIAIYRKKIEYIKAEEKKKTIHAQQIAEQEMKVLRAQMNPHFIFNALNSIHNCILQKDPLTAANSLTKFARLVRNILDNSMHNSISLRKELNSLELYIQVEQLRFSKKLSYAIELDPSLDAESIQIPPLVLQPFVENSIWHGLIPSEKEGKITIKLHDCDQSINISVIDNGIGRKKSEELKNNTEVNHKSHGLNITIDRIIKFNEENIDLTNFSIVDILNDFNEPAGTKVSFNLKKKYN